MDTQLRSPLMLAARVLITVPFLASAGILLYAHRTRGGGSLGPTLVAAATLQLVGSLSLLLGCYTRLGAVLLLVVALASTLVPARLNLAPAVRLADPSVYPQRSERPVGAISVMRTRRQMDAQRRLQLSLFTHKAALLGGLLLVLAHGAGGWSVDGLLERRRTGGQRDPEKR